MVINTLNTFSKDLLHLFFPHFCQGCGSDVIEETSLLCLKCSAQLPETGFFSAHNNPVEKTFYGRLPLDAAAAAYYFTKDSLIQHLITELKYRCNKDIGIYLGKLTGMQLRSSERFTSIDCIVPLPLNPKKLEKRGYNQAAVICEGLAAVLNIPVIHDAITRRLFTETQTKKDRVNRWQTMEEAFELKHHTQLQGKHVLLVDDIITTGATLEACGNLLRTIPDLKLSIAAVAWTI